MANIAGVIVVDGHNPLRDTISALSVGEYAWVLDVGLELFGAGLLAVAIGLLVLRGGGVRRNAVAAICILLAADMVVIAEHDGYAGEPTFGWNLHSYATVALWVLVVLAAFLVAPDLGAVRRRWRWASVAAGALWIPLPPLFLHMSRHPNSWDGLLERFLGMVLLLWVAMLARLLFARAGAGGPSERRGFA